MAKDEEENNEENEEDEEETSESETENGNGEVETLLKQEINFKDIGEDRTVNSEISSEMQKAYIDYAMSVIVSRALPAVEDGLKPVHRRILYAMDQMGLDKGPTKKCARIVGDVMGKYHPHGDASIYDALVRMAQDFSLRYPLVHGQGNFGSMDADAAASMRYTEAKLDKIALELLQDLDKETVPFAGNFDNSLKEPLILPGKIPNLLINGSSGIAVGMATNIPPHNLIEVCDAIISLIDKPNSEIKDLLEIIKGPDFPTGGVMVTENLLGMYSTGKGAVTLRGSVKTESGKTKEAVIIEEVPYQINKSELVKQIAELARDKKLADVSDIRDESSKGKVRVVIELRKGVDPKFTINRLYKSTNLQTRFNATFVALDNGVPKTMNLKQILEAYILHRRKIVRKRSEFDLKKSENRLHIVEGLLIAQKQIDKVIETIKKSKTTLEASENLQKKFDLSKKQAEEWILVMQKRRMSASHINNTAVILERYMVFTKQKVKLIRVKKLKPLVKDTLSEGEIARILAACSNKREKAMIAVLAYSGLRASELCNLTVPNVDLDKGIIQVINGKGGKDGVSYISRECCKIVNEYLQDYSTNPHMFKTLIRKTRYTTWALRKMVKKIAKKAGIEKRVYPHLFRHSLATNLVKRGANVLMVQKQLRHEKLETTQIYIRSFPGRVQDEYQFFVPEYL